MCLEGNLPSIATKTSSGFHPPPGHGRHRRSRLAYSWPNSAHQRRTVSQETSMPRSGISCSTSRQEGGKRKSQPHAVEMISTG